jgi:hypothetical protein
MPQFECIENRAAIVVEPIKPFIDWLNYVDPKGEFKLGELGELTIYLIPECDNDKDLEKYLKENYKPIFDEELEGWFTDEKLLPKERTYAMFKEWFKITFHSMIYDMCEGDLIKEM